MTAQKKYPVTGGPHKWDLSIALFDDKPRIVTFHSNCEFACLIEVSVSGVQAKQDPTEGDRSHGNHWNIEGVAEKVTPAFDVKSGFVPPEAGRVHIEYCTNSRRGSIRFL